MTEKLNEKVSEERFTECIKEQTDNAHKNF